MAMAPIPDAANPRAWSGNPRVGGGDRIHPGKARKSGCHGAQ